MPSFLGAVTPVVPFPSALLLQHAASGSSIEPEPIIIEKESLDDLNHVNLSPCPFFDQSRYSISIMVSAARPYKLEKDVPLFCKVAECSRLRKNYPMPNTLSSALLHVRTYYYCAHLR